ncbi:MAG: hypothetical protein U0074_08510 [Kouleothrix sp.]
MYSRKDWTHNGSTSKLLSKAQGGKAGRKTEGGARKELQVEKELDTGMSDYLSTVERLTAEGKQKQAANVARQSKLDAAIASGRQYTGDLQA